MKGVELRAFEFGFGEKGKNLAPLISLCVVKCSELKSPIAHNITNNRNARSNGEYEGVGLRETGKYGEIIHK